MRNKYAKLLLTATDGLVGTVADTLLFFFYLYGASFGKHGSVGVYRAFEEAQAQLTDLNYQTIKQTVHKLTSLGMVKRSKDRSAATIAITQQGRKRFEALFPTYQENRLWDGHVYLISYDIPTNQNWARDLLRRYIRKTGGALLQESLWINLYNPTRLLEEFTSQYRINGTILVSKLGTDGAVGVERLEDLIVRVYHLKDLANRYKAFLAKYQHRHAASPIRLAIDYYATLKDDPQLPFALLPKDFPAAAAYRLFQAKRRSILSGTHVRGH